MKIVWFRAWDAPNNISIAVETTLGSYEAKLPYDDGDGSFAGTQSHFFSEKTLRDAVARGQWVIEREIDSSVPATSNT